MLSIFTHMCENFIGVELCLDIFRFFYVARLQPGLATGSYSFCLRDGVINSYLEMNLKSPWLGWREEWFYLTTDDSLDNFRVPEALARFVESWASCLTPTTEVLSLADLVRGLAKVGLSGSDVMRDFIKRKLCPL